MCMPSLGSSWIPQSKDLKGITGTPPKAWKNCGYANRKKEKKSIACVCVLDPSFQEVPWPYIFCFFTLCDLTRNIMLTATSRSSDLYLWTVILNALCTLQPYTVHPFLYIKHLFVLRSSYFRCQSSPFFTIGYSPAGSCAAPTFSQDISHGAECYSSPIAMQYLVLRRKIMNHLLVLSIMGI